MGRDEVLQHRKALLEVREDRVLDDLLTALDTRFLRLGHKTTHTRELTNLLLRTAGTRVEHHVYGVEAVLIAFQGRDNRVGQLVIDIRPDIDYLVITLVVRDKTHVVVAYHGIGRGIALVDELLLLPGDDHSIEVERQTALECHAVTHVLDIVEERSHLVGTGLLHDHGDDVAQRALRKHLVDISHLLGYDLIEEDTADSSLLQHLYGLSVLVQIAHHALNDGMQVGTLLVVGDDRLLGAVEHMTCALDSGTRLGNIVQTEDHILRRHGNRRTVGGVEDVVRTEHKQLSLQYGGIAQRQVHGHLVAVEVGVERRTCQRVELHCLTLDQLGLESLNTQTVKGRGTVHKYRMTLDDILQYAPDDGVLAVDDLLGRLDRLDDTALDELTYDERLVELGRHILRDTHLVHLQLGTYDDDRTRRVVDTLTQKVLAETSLLTFERVRERLQRTVRLVLDGIALARVVEQRVDGLLQHTLLVAQDDFGSLDLDKTLQAVVADDDATAQLGRDDRNIGQHHPLGFVLAVRGAERLDDVQALQRLALTLLRRLFRSLVAQGI